MHYTPPGGDTQADVSVTKTDSADPVDAASNFSYTVQVSNAGPSTATTVSVSDTLPAGMSFVNATGTGWSCGETGGVVTCTRASLAVGSAPAITINVTAPDEGGTITNNVTVTAAQPDPTTPNQASEDTSITAIADLSISKTDSADPVDAGSAYSYTIDVSNAGPSTATMVQVVDTLPAGVSFVNAAGTNWSCAEAPPGTVTCDLTGSIAASGMAPSLTLNVTAPNAEGDITNDAMVTAVESDPSTPNQASQMTTVTGFDFGDAPDPTYPTLIASDGARHGRGSGVLILGTAWDTELDGQPNADATGDDAQGSPDDEDAADFTTVNLVADNMVTLDVTVTDDGSTPGLLSLWIDFDQDGVFASPAEQVAVDVPVSPVTGSQVVPVSFTVPAAPVPGTTFARLRLASTSGLTAGGAAPDGEVEDYAVTIQDPTTFDSDGDGVVDALEDMVPGEGGLNPGDGNGDGTADKFQANVNSLQDAVTGCWWTIQTNGAQQSAVATVPAGGPIEVTYPCGFATFQSQLNDGQNNLVVDLYLSPPNTEMVGVLKFNQELGRYRVIGRVNQSEDKTTIRYSMSDNGSFDTDPALGSIGDPVGPAALLPLPGPAGPAAIPALDVRALAVLIGLFALLIWIGGRRRRVGR